MSDQTKKLVKQECKGLHYLGTPNKAKEYKKNANIKKLVKSLESLKSLTLGVFGCFCALFGRFWAFFGSF